MVHPIICFCILFLIFFIPGILPTSSLTIYSEQYQIPILQWEPKSHDFGYVHEDNLYQTTFEIWNNGSGEMPWSLDVKKPWISVFPMKGISSGEHDLITVILNTTGLSPGTYEGNVYIHSEGDYIFYTYFIITEAILTFDPIELFIIYNDSIPVWNTTFKLWNSGTGDISYSLSPSKPWITVFPESGILRDFINTIFVTVNISQINTLTCDEHITISSTGGNAILPIHVVKNFPPSIPSIKGPEKGSIRTDMFFTISSTDDLSNNIWYWVDWGDNTISEWIGSYTAGEVVTLSHSWMNQGKYSIRCKARDEYNSESDWATLTVTMPYIYHKPILPFLEFLIQRFFDSFSWIQYLFSN